MNFTERRTVLLMLVLLFGIFVAFKALPYRQARGNFTIIMHRNNESVNDLFQERDIFYTEIDFIDTIDFVFDRQLSHRVHGPYPFYADYFVDIEGEIFIENPGLYEIRIMADSGYSFIVNNSEVITYAAASPQNRLAYERVLFQKGLNKIAVHYFVGDYPSNLQVSYRRYGGRKYFLFGENSEDMEFGKS